MTDRAVEPYLLVHSRGEWYYVCWCRTAGGTRVFRVATTKSARAPRRDLRAARGRRARPLPARGHPRLRQLRAQGRDRLVQPGRAPLDRRAAAGASCCRTAPASRASPTSTSAGSPHHLLRFADQARPLAPPEAVDGVRDVVRRLLEALRVTRDARRESGRLRRLPRRLGLLRLRPAARHLPALRLVGVPAHATATCSTGWSTASCRRCCRSSASSSCGGSWRRGRTRGARRAGARRERARLGLLRRAAPARAPRRRLRAAGGAPAGSTAWRTPSSAPWREPVGAPRLRELARGARTVVVTIPDASRPCPSEPVLQRRPRRARRRRRPRRRRHRGVGCGLHATTTAAERARAGRRVDRRARRGRRRAGHRVGDAPTSARPRWARRCASRAASPRPTSSSPSASSSRTSTPASPAASRASPSAAPGARRSPGRTARRSSRSRASPSAGLRGNPFQATLREIAARTPLALGRERGDDARAARPPSRAGDPAAVQEALAARRGAGVAAHGRPAPTTSSSPASTRPRATTSTRRAGRPPTSASPPARRSPTAGSSCSAPTCRDGAGDGPGERNFPDVLAAAATPADLLARGLREPLGPGGQRAFVVARVLERFRLAVVGAAEPAFLEPLAHLGVAAFDSVDAALAAEDAARPPRLRARRRRRDGHGRHRRLTAPFAVRAPSASSSPLPSRLAGGTTQVQHQ